MTRRRGAMVLAIAMAAACAAGMSAAAAAGWCLGLSGLGAIRTGMSLDEVLRLADFRGLERRRPSGDCWYLHYDGNGADFDLMIIGGRVARIEIKGASTLRTISGARIGSTEEELRTIYGGRLDRQPHKYDQQGHTITFRAADGLHGLRFETSAGRVRAMQAGPWEHLNYVEGCS
jgi:hypothetical protein